MRRLAFRGAIVALSCVGATAAGDSLTAADAADQLSLDTVVDAGLAQATDLTFLPDGRMVIIEKTGRIVLRAADGNLSTAGTISVNANNESGLLGIVADPDFATNGRLIVYYTHPTNGQTVGYVTLTAAGTLVSATPTLLIDGIRGENHVGGGLNIGPDGKLYISVGDATGNPPDDPTNPDTWNPWSWYPSCVDSLNGKILRINTDGSIPIDNPFFNTTNGTVCNNDGETVPTTTGPALKAIWARGFRNPWRFSFDPLTGRMWVGDVGKSNFEEISNVEAGKHYGWSYREGAHGDVITSCNSLSPAGNCTDPIWECAHSGTCASIIGGVFIRSCAWPTKFRDKYVFGDFVPTNPIKMLTPNADATGVVDDVTTIGNFTTPPSSVRLGPDGNVYFALFDTASSRIVRLAPKVPSDCNPCTTDSCDPINGCVYAPVTAMTPCDDGDVCTRNDACDAAGNCVAGAALNCSDGNDCTFDVCDPITGCSNLPAVGGTCNGDQAPVGEDGGCSMGGAAGGSSSIALLAILLMRRRRRIQR